ncbi:DUF6440 family protein [Lentilactobacillus raoultii]|uniref:DUF6440 family protein n=1 Tax=Lentilactobacillus raoultii TaxID=1987503 RepID=A0ABW3PL32_9LACO|nr:DUF6440 family protein [Lentilactobacillus raoultii]
MFGKEKRPNRFEVTADELVGTAQNVDIIVDHKTGVQYLVVSQGGTGNGVTVLVDQDGKPLLAK